MVAVLVLPALAPIARDAVAGVITAGPRRIRRRRTPAASQRLERAARHLNGGRAEALDLSSRGQPCPPGHRLAGGWQALHGAARRNRGRTTMTERDDTRTPGRGHGGSSPLERVTVNLTPRSARALELATQLTGDTKTDTINRALQIYAFLEQVTATGGSIYARETADSELVRLKVF